jgi:uncharacterized membrane protein
MDPHVQEWLSLGVRWFHVITGVAWIGASFYFNWLENQLDRKGSHLRDGVAGDLWAIHGGGFYFLEKFKLAPPKIPENLHWFKYEAYFTWLSGFTLLIIVYYLNVDTQVIDSSVRELTGAQAIGIGIGSMIGGWIVYDLLCKSPLVKKPTLFAVLCIGLAIGISYFLAHMFGPKAAYIHVGAVLGTIMAANVFFVIIPSQKKFVNCAEKGDPVDPSLGANAGLRSRHNNYITLPVLFIMISNHYPSTYGHGENWAILAGVSIVGASVRHWFNIRHLPEKKVWILPTAALGFIALAFITAPKTQTVENINESIPSTVEIASIFAERCVTCHSQNPTDSDWSKAPNGVMFDEIDKIVAFKDSIKLRVVDTTIMPLGNKTKMTEAERKKVGRWLEAQ